MTMQANDSFMFKRKKFVLIDVENGKQIIDSADFCMQEHKPVLCTSCRRGYVAEYVVKQGKLYGTKYEQDAITHKEKGSDTMLMNYTGSCVIARMARPDGWVNADFLSGYTRCDEAYELHFTNGVLDEEIDLAPVIAKTKELVEADVRQEDIEATFARWEQIGDIARTGLKYEYDVKSYKWR